MKNLTISVFGNQIFSEILKELKLSMVSKEKKLIKIFKTILNIKKEKFSDNLSSKSCKTWD